MIYLCGFNRTFMELKYERFYQAVIKELERFNRTFMELKYYHTISISVNITF